VRWRAGRNEPPRRNNMAAMRLRRAFGVPACLLAAAALIGGCGGDSDSSTSSGSASAESRPAPPKGEFPSAAGKSLAEVLKSEMVEGPSELVVSPAAQAFYLGKNRYPFGVFRRDGSQVPDAEVALYFARVPKKPGAAATAGKEALDQPAVGPFPAAIESLQTQPAFRARTTTDDPDAASVVYYTDVDFPGEGEWRIAALIKEGDEVTGTLLPSAEVGRFARVPRPGQKAPVIHTPTAADTGGDLSQITTRLPPDTQNQVDYADVLGKEPVILLFATPQFCQSRVCGPVVDVAEQVKELYGDEAEFIHMEIFNDNDPNEGVRPQVRAFRLPSEPWLFGIDRQGTIQAEIEGAFGVDALTRVVEEVTGNE
jgi:hypothetical protein